MACAHCGKVGFGMHDLVRQGKRVTLCADCLRQGAVFVAAEDEIASIMAPGLKAELWQEGQLVYLLRVAFTQGRPPNATEA